MSHNEKVIITLIGVASLIIIACAAETFLLPLLPFLGFLIVASIISVVGVYLLANEREAQTTEQIQKVRRDYEK